MICHEPSHNSLLHKSSEFALFNNKELFESEIEGHASAPDFVDKTSKGKQKTRHSIAKTSSLSKIIKITTKIYRYLAT